MANTRLLPANHYVDDYGACIGTIEQEHAKIHAGLGFTVSARADINNGGGTFMFAGVTAANNYPHFRKIIIGSAGGPFDVDFYEGTDLTANGTAVTSFNNDRNSATTPDLSVYHTPTIGGGGDGTLLEAILVPGGKQTGALGSEGSNEWILKPSTNYMIRITNNTSGGSTSEFAINMFWYE